MKKIIKKLKAIYRKVKFLDKTDANCFKVLTIISFFCLFIGTTYLLCNNSTFECCDNCYSKTKNQLTSINENFNNNSITIGAGETVELTLELKSLNTENTKYALNCSCDSSDVKVYYVENKDQNVQGVIGGLNSIIDINIAIENNSSSDQTVNFDLKGGYLQNTLVSNITKSNISSLGILKALNLQSLDGTPDFS